ncbi:putative O-methyltransferase [Mollisia scopiformis]|uniref:Putative O-methyltransferase n=1 Tax=Mollisia scopiformis TaxID=149040 RepID=A0A194XPS3_MOLSC|nr:putative O-methyltransferase [Mollisia scopiformis]KUJ22193.1 putative O-methyltransferase [Mollisia scopiformis]
MAKTRISELAAIISTKTEIIEQYLRSHNLASPSFDVDYVDPQLPPDIAVCKVTISEATEELNSLLAGPSAFWTTLDTTFLPTIHAIYRFKLASSFPIGGEASFAFIASAVDIPEPDVQRIIRLAITHRIFREPRRGIVTHTAISKAIATIPLLQSFLGLVTEEIWPASTRIVDAIEKWPNSEEPNETGYNLATNQYETYFNGMKKDPDRGKRFADVMNFTHAGGKFERAGLIAHYDWACMSEGLVVELGGSQGMMCFDLARYSPKMKCISQDLPDVVAGVEVPEDLKGRVEVVAHDFFTEQPVKNADAYLFRWIFHDWSDKYSIRILRKLIPALKHGARIVTGKVCLPEPGSISYSIERRMRATDMVMKACLNGRERDVDQWAQLFTKSDSRFNFKGVIRIPGSRWSVIEVIWEDVSV